MNINHFRPSPKGIHNNVFPGQRVVTSAGTIRTVAFVQRERVFVHGPSGLPEPAVVKYDALGGEAGERGLAA